MGRTGHLRKRLEGLYRQYNRTENVHPDPLELVLPYSDPLDREVAALVASSLAFGRVGSIVASVARILSAMGSPRLWVLQTGDVSMRRALRGFRHRWVDGENVACLLGAARDVIRDHGSLEGCVTSHDRTEDATVLSALRGLATELDARCGGGCGFLVADPGSRSAHKRLNLMARWLVRHDSVDPGGWSSLDPARLVVPLDVHMHRVGVALGFTRRPRADLDAALQVTAGFRRICPDDPVRYDFCLTRRSMLGIDPRI